MVELKDPHVFASAFEPTLAQALARTPPLVLALTARDGTIHAALEEARAVLWPAEHRIDPDENWPSGTLPPCSLPTSWSASRLSEDLASTGGCLMNVALDQAVKDVSGMSTSLLCCAWSPR